MRLSAAEMLRLVRPRLREALGEEAGTSQGAKKGWETRKGGGGGIAAWAAKAAKATAGARPGSSPIADWAAKAAKGGGEPEPGKALGGSAPGVPPTAKQRMKNIAYQQKMKAASKKMWASRKVDPLFRDKPSRRIPPPRPGAKPRVDPLFL